MCAYRYGFSPDMLVNFVGIGTKNWLKPLTTGTLGMIDSLVDSSMAAKQALRIGKVIARAMLSQSSIHLITTIQVSRRPCVVLSA